MAQLHIVVCVSVMLVKQLSEGIDAALLHNHA